MLKLLQFKFLDYQELYKSFSKTHTEYNLPLFSNYCNSYIQSLKVKLEMYKRYYENQNDFGKNEVHYYMTTSKKIEALDKDLKFQIRTKFKDYIISKALRVYKDERILNDIFFLIDFSLPYEQQEEMYFSLLQRELKLR